MPSVRNHSLFQKMIVSIFNVNDDQFLIGDVFVRTSVSPAVRDQCLYLLKDWWYIESICCSETRLYSTHFVIW